MDNKEVNNEEKKPNLKVHIPLYVLEVLVLIIAIFATVVIGKITRAEKVNLDLSKIHFNGESLEDMVDSVNGQPEVEVDSVEEDVQEAGNKPLANNDFIQDDAIELAEDENIDKDAISKELYEKYNGYFNIAFFGVDSREGSLGAGTRSDSMMVCSIDMNTHEVKLISVYRDTYLNLGNGSYNKCNAAYAYGGPEQALSMLNMNLDIYVNQYVTVGFEGLIDAIDALGGIPVNVQENEVFHLNNYQMAMAEQLGCEYVPVIYPGLQILNGLQATAYCRIRYTQGDDFRRAERQRYVVSAMLERAGKSSVSSLTDAVSKVLPNISTSLSVGDIVNMLSVAGDYSVTVSDGFPFEGKRNGGTIGSKGSCVVPYDLEANVNYLHKKLYGEENYVLSPDIKKYSDRIKADTNEFLAY